MASTEYDKAYARKWYRKNAARRIAQIRAYKAKDPSRWAAYGLAYRRRKAGIPKPLYPAPGHCELCGTDRPGRNTWHIDHCHATGKFRGWLCGPCNLGLGSLGDTEEGLLRALAYLRRNFDE